MPTPLQIRAARALRVRLEQITVANGYLTDTGLYVRSGRVWDEVASRDDLTLIAGVIDGGDVKTADGQRRMTLQQVLYVDHYITPYPGHERKGEAIIEQRADIRRAAMAGRGNLSDDEGTFALLYIGSEPIDSPAGSKVEGMRQEYRIPMEEAYGDPTSR